MFMKPTCLHSTYSLQVHIYEFPDSPLKVIKQMKSVKEGNKVNIIDSHKNKDPRQTIS